MTAPLAVVLEGRVVGRVERTRSNVVRFAYDHDATAPGLTPLSLSMPTSEARFTGDRVERFLRALLPESDGALRAIERRFPGVDRRDELSLLAAIGKDCPGAVQFCSVEEVESTIARTGTLLPQSAADIEQRLAELRVDEDASWTMPGEHWSLGGTQAKFALRRVGGGWFEATGSQPTSHIFKPGIHGMRAQSLVEHVSMRAAAACGLDVAPTEHAEFKSESAVVIARFDRRTVGDDLVRLHQEDLCQALGVSEKYEEYGGPSAARIIELLRARSMNAVDAAANIDRFVDGLIFNTVIAAPDAHARNYAVLLDGERVRLAPLFDIATGLAYESSVSRTLSMSVGGELRAERVGGRQWRQFADANGLDAERVVHRVREVVERAPRAMLAALDEVDDWDGSVSTLRARLAPALEAHVTVVRERLDAR